MLATLTINWQNLDIAVACMPDVGCVRHLCPWCRHAEGQHMYINMYVLMYSYLHSVCLCTLSRYLALAYKPITIMYVIIVYVCVCACTFIQSHALLLNTLLDHVFQAQHLQTPAGRSMNVPDMAKVLNHLRRDPVVKVSSCCECSMSPACNHCHGLTSSQRMYVDKLHQECKPAVQCAGFQPTEACGIYRSYCDSHLQ